MAEQKLSRDEQVSANAHIPTCSSCAAELQGLQRLIHLMQTDSAEDAPRDVIAQALNIFQQRAALSEPSVWRRIVAALSFDSLTAAPAFGMRSGPASSRQLLFQAEDNDLDLRVSQQADYWVVSGQFLGSGCASGQVELRGDEERVTADLNDLCEFTLPAVPAGTYRLQLRFEGTEVEVPQLELGK